VALYPIALSLHRVSAEALTQSLAGIGLDTGVELERLWKGSELVDVALGDEPVPPLSPRVAVRAAEYTLPAGLVAELEARLRENGSADRLDEVLEELTTIRRECGWPPLASPIGQVLGSQALLHVLSAQRWRFVVDELRDLVEGRYGSPPEEVDSTVRRAVQLLGDGVEQAEEPPEALEELREDAKGLAASEEELLLLALYGEDAEPLLRSVRGRGRRDESETAGLTPGEAERLREIIRVVQESGIGELTIEEGEMRVTVRRADERGEIPVLTGSVPTAPVHEEPEGAVEPPQNDVIRVESPMVGTFYRAPQPGAPAFVEEGDMVEPGQTLCILEAMKLMNEIKAEGEGIVRRICVENAAPVQYGDVLFELDPLNGRPLDAL
jgi:oxaloacetate decarboxylase (Na+ extruding) subunit alpha